MTKSYIVFQISFSGYAQVIAYHFVVNVIKNFSYLLVKNKHFEIEW